MSDCKICDGPCVCKELDGFLNEVQDVQVLNGVRMSTDMFEVGFGRSLKHGDQVVNVVVHRPGEMELTSPRALMMSFDKETTRELIGLLIGTWRHLWGDEEE